MKDLSFLLQNIGKYEITGSIDRQVEAIAFDSRKVNAAHPNTLFVAQRGTQVDGHSFIGKVIEQGGRMIVCEEIPETCGCTTLPQDITFIKVPNSDIALGLLASAFYDFPSQKLHLVGITGTNGKTTTVTLLYRLFRQMGYPTGLLSTIENRIEDTVIPTNHTTPDAIELNALLHQMVETGCQYCFMEVSSHAICQHRIAGLHFSGGIFSNITHDHLDYHKTFAEYIKAKKKFFDELPETAFALTNIDDKNGLVMTQNSKAKVHTYSLLKAADFKGVVLDNDFTGLQMTINGQEVYFKLCGRFNAYNLLAIYGAAILLGMKSEEVLPQMSGLGSAAGRFQLIRNNEGGSAIVDYAHTPDALKNVLSTINDITQHSANIITVVGCGGDRDKLKRPEMAAIACELSDKVILTSDNPRTEKPEDILNDMLTGVTADQKRKVLVIENRHEAIKTACMLMQGKDVLLVAGKGHENYQEINHVKHHFDDTEEIKANFNL